MISPGEHIVTASCSVAHCVGYLPGDRSWQYQQAKDGDALSNTEAQAAYQKNENASRKIRECVGMRNFWGGGGRGISGFFHLTVFRVETIAWCLGFPASRTSSTLSASIDILRRQNV